MITTAPTAEKTRATIVKSDGSVQAFDPEKLAASLRRTGAGAHTAERITHTITSSVGYEVTSSEIYRKAFAMLRREARPAAARYALRRALLELGPSGHPFEDLIAELFKTEGWNVEWRKIIRGKCIEHEVDVYATRNGPSGIETMAAELKYHNDAFYKTDVKTALYVKARLDDIWNCDPKLKTCPVDRGMLITNTKFTSQAVEYAMCSGMELLGWSYPAEGNLYDRMVGAGLYPVTTLTMLKPAEKRLLVNQGIVTSSQLGERREALRALHIPAERIGAIITEMRSLAEPFAYGN
jgi:hypothetical protein